MLTDQERGAILADQFLSFVAKAELLPRAAILRAIELLAEADSKGEDYERELVNAGLTFLKVYT